MRRREFKRLLLASLGIIAALLLTSGCTYFGAQNADSAAGQAADKGASPQYYDFGDVLVPSELEVDKDESFVYKTPGFSAGVLILKARVERNSLIAFFENNMAKDNWSLISSFKSPRTMMLFNKGKRWCVINITDGGLDYNTHVEIWVAPTVGVGGGEEIESSGLLK
jgi:hypothetical protein